LHRFASIQWVEAILGSNPTALPRHKAEATQVRSERVFEARIRSIVEDQCAKRDTSVTVVKIKASQRSVSIWFKRTFAAGRSRRAAPLLFLYPRAPPLTSHLYVARA
jgi:hypothetical protein